MIAHRLLSRLSPEWRVRVGSALVDATFVGWPLTALTVARHEPQFVLGLSWLALGLTGWDILNTADVRREQEVSDGREPT